MSMDEKSEGEQGVLALWNMKRGESEKKSKGREKEEEKVVEENG